jgi:hypothetical protein
VTITVGRGDNQVCPFTSSGPPFVSFSRSLPDALFFNYVFFIRHRVPDQPQPQPRGLCFSLFLVCSYFHLLIPLPHSPRINPISLSIGPFPYKFFHSLRLSPCRRELHVSPFSLLILLLPSLINSPFHPARRIPCPAIRHPRAVQASPLYGST